MDQETQTQLNTIQNQLIHIGEENKKLNESLQELKNKINKIDGHVHSGKDYPQISGSDLLGFRYITVSSDASVDPTFGAHLGTIVIQDDGTNVYLFVRITSGWKSVQLT